MRDLMPAVLAKRSVWIVLMIVLAGIAGIAGWWRHRAVGPTEQLYLTTPVSRADIADTVLATGTIKALRQVNIGAQVSGQVKALSVVLGQRVTAGELVAEIDPRTQQNQLRNAEASLHSYEAQLRVKQATLAKARLDANRQQQMFADEATSRENLDNARAALAVAEAEVAQLQAQIEQGRVAVETARVNLGYTRIAAPIDGIVVAVPVEVGQTVNANQTTPTLVTLAQLDTVTIKAEISEGDVTRVRPGMNASFSILGEPDKRYPATLRAIDPGPQSLSDSTSTATGSSAGGSGSSSSANSEAIYYYGLLDVANPDNRLRINMTAQVSIVVAEAKQALTIPAMALGEALPDGRWHVDVLGQDGQPQSRTVRIGINNHVNVEVLDGLKAGEAVITGRSAPGEKSAANRGRAVPVRL